MQEETRAKFEAVISGLQIPEEAKKNIANEIRKAVLNEIARLDLKGDLVVKRLPKGERFLEEIGPTDGIVADVKEESNYNR
jgi:hypothetical protein